MYRLSLASVTLTFVLVATLTSEVSGKCQFPEFLQRDDAWVGDYKYGLLVAYVKGDRIDLSQSEEGGVSATFTRECVQQETAGKYLVRHKEPKQRALYRCIQFFQRGDRVVQIRASNYSRALTSAICAEEKMFYDPYPWVQMRETTNSIKSCPFIGGYNMYVYYPPPNNSLVCGNTFLMMRMESECERGGGIVFDFRKVECVPRGLPPTAIQQVHCVTHWTQGDYTFIILQHAQDDQQWWCLRIADVLTELSSAFLWLEVVCDMTKIPALDVSSNYLSLQFHSRVFSSTCADELEMCEETQHYCKMNFKYHCAATCRECQSEKNIGECTFDEQYRGQWIDSGKGRDSLVNVRGYGVMGKEIGTYSCLMLETDLMPDKRVLLELYDNGCYPRYACLEMSKVNSSVMKFRLGHRHAWPLWGVQSIKEHICKDKNFLMHSERSKYAKERPPRLLVNTDNAREVHCGLPKHLQNGIAFNEDGRACQGCLNYMPEQNPRMFTIRPINCSEDGESAGSPTRALYYSCLASFSFHNNSYSVVTKTSSFAKGMGHYLVWIFTPEDQIKVMKASETFLYESKRHLDSRDIEARFSILRNDKLNCRSYQDWPYLPSTSTSTSTTSTTPYYSINNGKYHRNDKGKNKNHKGGEGDKGKGKHVTFKPVDPKNEGGVDTAGAGSSQTQNLHSGNGNGKGCRLAGSTTTLTFLTLISLLVVMVDWHRISAWPHTLSVT